MNKRYRSNKSYSQGDWVLSGDFYYESQCDSNNDLPTEGTCKNPKTWDGGYSKEEYEIMIKEHIDNSYPREEIMRKKHIDNSCDQENILSLEGAKPLIDGEKITKGQIRKYNGAVFIACKDLESSICFPDSRDWSGPFGIADLLDISGKCELDKYTPSIDIWSECPDDECVTVYGLGEYVAFKTEDGQYLIYRSEVNFNTCTPGESDNWSGGKTLFEYLDGKSTIIGTNPRGAGVVPIGVCPSELICCDADTLTFYPVNIIKTYGSGTYELKVSDTKTFKIWSVGDQVYVDGILQYVSDEIGEAIIENNVVCDAVELTKNEV